MALVLPAAFRSVTGQDAVDDAVLTPLLADAQRALQELLQRPLEQPPDPITELVRVRYDGRAFPEYMPVTSVVTPGWTVTSGYLSSESAAPFPDITINYPEEGHFRLRDVLVEYVGGYTAATLHVVLRNAIIALADGMRNGVSVDELMMSGAKSVSVGDVKIERGSPQLASWAGKPDLSTLLRYRRRR